MKRPVAVILAIVLVPAFLAEAGDEDEDFEVLHGAIRDGLYEFACEKAVEFLREYSATDRAADVYLLLGVAMFHTGKYEDSLKALAKVRKSRKGVSLLQDVLYWEGENLLEQGKNDEAIDAFRKLLKEYPQTNRAADAIYALGWAQAGSGRMEEAITAFRNLLKESPSFRDADLVSFKIGKWLYDTACFKKAVEELKLFPQRYQRSTYVADAYYWAAESYFELKEWKKARLSYELAVKTSRDPLLTAYSKYGLGWVMAEEGNPEEAVAILLKLQQGDVPEDLVSSANFRAAGILFSRKKYERAAGFYLLLLDDERYGNRARFSMGECQYHAGRYEEAVQTYAKVPLDDKKLSIDVLTRTGWCHFKLGNYDKATESFKKVIALAKDSAERAVARARIADILFNSRQYAEAAEAYTRSLEDGPVGPEKEHVLYWLGWSQYKNEQYEKAVAAFERLLKECSTGEFTQKAMEKLARSYFAMEKFGQAAEVYLKLLEKKDIEKELREIALYQVAECYFNAKDYEGAAQQFGEVIRVLPGTDLAKQALYGKAMCRQGEGRIEEANDILRSFLRRHPDDELAPNAALLLANNTYKLSKFEDASGEYRALISAYPEAEEVGEGYYWLGWCFYNLDNMPRAAEVWQEAVRVRPASRYRDEILLGMGEALWKQGRHAEAEKIFQDLTAADIPAELIQRANVSYADLLQIKTEYGQAIKRYSEALRGPNVSVRAKAQFGIAESQYHARNYKEALDAYAKVMYVYKQFEALAAKARFRTARCLGKLNRWDEAKAMYGKIIKSGGDAEKARILLEDLEKK